MFNACGHGFSLTLDNGYRVSVKFGGGYYCEKRDERIDSPQASSCIDAETAIISPSGKLIDYKDECVQGYQSVQDIIDTLNYVSKFK
jgi:hypothetical protein